MHVSRRSSLAAAAAICLLLQRPAVASDSSLGFFSPLLGDLKSELDTARKEKKKGIVLIYEMDGCPFCERLKRVALRDPQVRQYYQAHFLPFRIDTKGATQLTDFGGSDGTEAAFAAKQSVRATPTIVFYDLAGKEVSRLVGPPTDAQEFLLLGRYVVDGHYRTESFASFRQAQRPGSK